MNAGSDKRTMKLTDGGIDFLYVSVHTNILVNHNGSAYTDQQWDTLSLMKITSMFMQMNILERAR